MQKPVIKDNVITIPSSEDYLVDVDNFVEGILENFGLDKSTIADIAISVTEVVVNSIIHGNKSILEKKVTVAVAKKDSLIEIMVTDQGEGFNPDELESPVSKENLLKEIGRGIFIVKSLMDKVEIEPGKSGTKVTLMKNV